MKCALIISVDVDRLFFMCNNISSGNRSGFTNGKSD